MSEGFEQVRSALADRYAVERILGSGGMATVYLADDLKHHRKVAVKVLKPEIAAALGGGRFLREIEISAALQHPHILPLFDSGEANGLLYYVMPFVEGEPVSARVAREGALPIEDAVRILREMVDALSYAHERGVIHRDIKPDNVMLSGSHAMVTDFGVAKAIRDAASSETLTSTGMALGTPAYMAPEQATADPNTDHRADIYAVGIVGYELLTGRPPFHGSTAQMVLAAHVTETPDQITKHRPAVPAALSALIMRCLEKLPADRVQRTEDLLHQLEAIGTPAGGTTPVVVTGVTQRSGSPKLIQVAALYAGASAVVLALAYAVMLALGLPDWVFLGAAMLLTAGLPIILVTSRVERLRADTAELPTPATDSGVSHWLTWRKAITGGIIAFAGLGLFVIAYMAMRVLGIGPVGTLVATGVLQERDKVILADFVDQAGDSVLATALTEAFRVDLGQSPTVTLVQADELDEALARMEQENPGVITVDLARELAVREGIKAVVSGRVNHVGGSYVITAELLASESGEVLVPIRETAKDSTEIIDAVDRLSNGLRERIGESLKSIRETPSLDRVTTASLPALRKYSEAKRAGEAGDAGRTVALLKEALELDTAFAGAHRALAIHLANYGIDRALMARSMSNAYKYRDRLTEQARLWTSGSYHMQRSEVQEALVPYLTLLEAEPDNAALINNFGVLYNLTRENERALEYYVKARDLEPRIPNGSFNVVVTNIELGRIDSARAEAARFAGLMPDHPLVDINGYFIAIAEFDYDEAERSLESWASHGDPGTIAIVTSSQAALAALRGRKEAADRLLQQGEGRARSGAFVPVYLQNVIGAALYDTEVRGRPAEGLSRVESALADFPLENLEPFDRPYAELAQFYARTGEPQRARALLDEFDREVHEEFKPLAQIQYFQARGYIALAEGRLDEALTEFGRADKGGCQICVLPGMARVYDRQQNADSVQVVLERYVLTPDDDRMLVDPIELPGVYIHLAELYEGHGDIENAVIYYNKLLELWIEADPEFQPQVNDVRDRIARLVGEPARR